GAENNLGLSYFLGQGVTQNYVRADYWLKKAAEQGNDRAETTIGIAYLKGLGVPQDSIKALSWLKKASAQGFQPAEHDIQILEHGHIE
ncbi:tetratricopeptide repeat protein, partial [Acidithiobacillus caldus]